MPRTSAKKKTRRVSAATGRDVQEHPTATTATSAAPELPLSASVEPASEPAARKLVPQHSPDSIKTSFQSVFDEKKRFIDFKHRSKADYSLHYTDAQIRAEFLRSDSAEDGRAASRVERAANLVLLQFGSANRVAKALGIPATTLKRAVHAVIADRVPAKVGRPQSLSIASERALVAWIVHEVQANRDPTEDAVLEMATHLKRKESGRDFAQVLPVRHSWLSGFMSRHPDLALRPVRSLEEVCSLHFPTTETK
jgi:hypothetical protein